MHHFLYIFQSMFLVFITAQCMHRQVTESLQIRKAYNILLFRKYTHCYQHSAKEWLNYGPQSFETYIILHNNHFDTHEAQHHEAIFNHRTDIMPYRNVLQIPTLCVSMYAWLCVSVCVCLCVCVCVCAYSV